MKLLKKRRIVINPECISQLWSNADSSKVSAYLSCSGEAAGSCLDLDKVAAERDVPVCSLVLDLYVDAGMLSNQHSHELLFHEVAVQNDYIVFFPPSMELNKTQLSTINSRLAKTS